MLWLFKFSDIIFIGLIAANSLLNINNISLVLASFKLKYPAQNITEGDPVVVGAVSKLNSAATFSGVQEAASCDENSNPTIIAVCPHIHETAFIIQMVLWGVYYIIFMIIRALFSWRFSFSDYRFPFYIDQFNSRWPSKILAIVGIIMTLASFAAGLQFLVSDWAPENPPAGDVWSMIMFLILNAIGLLFSAQYARSFDASVWDTDFGEEIPIVELPGGNGILNVAALAFNRQAFFTQMQYALTEHFAGRGGLDKLTTKPELLIKMMITLSEDAAAKEAAAEADAKKSDKEMKDNAPSAVETSA